MWNGAPTPGYRFVSRWCAWRLGHGGFFQKTLGNKQQGPGGCIRFPRPTHRFSQFARYHELDVSLGYLRSSLPAARLTSEWSPSVIDSTLGFRSPAPSPREPSPWAARFECTSEPPSSPYPFLNTALVYLRKRFSLENRNPPQTQRKSNYILSL